MCALLYQGSIPTQSFALLEHLPSQCRTSDTCKTVHRWGLNNLAILSRSWFLGIWDRVVFVLGAGSVVPYCLPLSYLFFVSQKLDKDRWIQPGLLYAQNIGYRIQIQNVPEFWRAVVPIFPHSPVNPLLQPSFPSSVPKLIETMLSP